MNKTEIIIVGIILFAMFTMTKCFAEGGGSKSYHLSTTINSDKVYRDYQEIEMARRTVARELLKFGFKLDYYNLRSSLFTSNSNGTDYLYQVHITYGKRNITIDAFVFLQGDYKWTWRIGDNQAMEKLSKIIKFCNDRIVDGPVHNMAVYDWFK